MMLLLLGLACAGPALMGYHTDGGAWSEVVTTAVTPRMGVRADGALEGGEAVGSLVEAYRQCCSTTLLLGIGEWTWNPAHDLDVYAKQDDDMVATLVAEILDAVYQLDADGVDLYLVDSFSRGMDSFSLVMTVIQGLERLRLDKKRIHVTVPPHGLNAAHKRDLAEAVDGITVLAFDYHGPWAGNTLLNPSTLDQVHGSMKAWASSVANPRKILLGVPAFARTWTLSDTTSLPASPVSLYEGEGVGAGAGIGSASVAGLLTREQVHQLEVQDEAEEHVHQQSQTVVGYYGPSQDMWLAMDSEELVLAKLQLVNTFGLGGAAVFSLDTDSMDRPLAAQMKSTMSSVAFLEAFHASPTHGHWSALCSSTGICSRRDTIAFIIVLTLVLVFVGVGLAYCSFQVVRSYRASRGKSSPRISRSGRTRYSRIAPPFAALDLDTDSPASSPERARSPTRAYLEDKNNVKFTLNTVAVESPGSSKHRFFRMNHSKE